MDARQELKSLISLECRPCPIFAGYLSWIVAGPKDVVALLRDMVAIPSVNPQGDPGTDQTGEQAMGEYVAAFLRDLGAEVQVEEVEPGRPNVTARFPSAEPGAPRIAFAPHLDTVSVAGMTIPPFDPVLRDEKVWGRGSTDTKGPMAAALWALREWAQSAERSRSRVDWVFLALMGEEAGNDGAWVEAKKGFASDLTLVLEPSDLKVLNTHKGIVWMDVFTSGTACHGSMPENGRSAIYAMRRVLETLEEEVIPMLAKRTHPQLGKATLNVGTISGGSKINIVPDRCRIELDCRIVPGLEPEELRTLIETTLRRAMPEVEVRMQRHGPALDTDAKLPWVTRLADTARGFAAGPFFSDASVLSSAKCPAVCIGPGRIEQAHTKDEFIEVKDLEAGADFFRRWIEIAEAAAA